MTIAVFSKYCALHVNASCCALFSRHALTTYHFFSFAVVAVVPLATFTSSLSVYVQCTRLA